MAPAPIKCKNTEPYTTRPLAGEFTWLVYNKRSGFIVAATYCENMAYALITGIKKTESYHDDDCGDYVVTEVWKSPEPMIG
jgi:hypothetical protein